MTAAPDLSAIIVQALRRQGSALSSAELQTLLRVSQPTVSKHLKVLRDAELVSVREDGQHRYYSLATAPLEVVDDWLVPFLIDETDTAILTDTYFDERGNPVLPGGAQHAAEVVGRTAAQAKHVVASAMKRFGA